MGSAETYTYLGTTPDKIYYEYANYVPLLSVIGLSKSPKITIFWTDRKQIPTSIISKLEAERKAFEGRRGKFSPRL